MSLTQTLRRVARWFVYLRRYGGKWAWPLARESIVPPPGTSKGANGALVVPQFGLTLVRPGSIELALLRVGRYAAGLHTRAHATLTLQEDRVAVEVDGIRFVATCEADLGILFEVFVERLYSFEASAPLRVIDIGANIGAASLYFAKHCGCEVDAFELVPSTAVQTRSNFDLNPSLSSQITLHPVGLGDQDKKLDLAISPSNRPSNSVYLPNEMPDAVQERVEVRNVAAVFAEIGVGSDGKRLLIKIDAEGSEYEILTALGSAGLLAIAEVIFIEWHPRTGRDPEQLREILRDAGFSWFERESPEVACGIISAFRSPIPDA